MVTKLSSRYISSIWVMVKCWSLISRSTYTFIRLSFILNLTGLKITECILLASRHLNLMLVVLFDIGKSLLIIYLESLAFLFLIAEQSTLQHVFLFWLVDFFKVVSQQKRLCWLIFFFRVNPRSWFLSIFPRVCRLVSGSVFLEETLKN